MLLHLSIVTFNQEKLVNPLIVSGRRERNEFERDCGAYLSTMVEELDEAILKPLDLEREAVDLAWMLHKGLTLLISEHIVCFVWLSCHFRLMDDFRLARQTTQ